MRALGWALLLAGLTVFVVTVDRSMWVLVSPVLLAGAALALVVGYQDVHTIGLREAGLIIDAEIRQARR